MGVVLRIWAPASEARRNAGTSQEMQAATPDLQFSDSTQCRDLRREYWQDITTSTGQISPKFRGVFVLGEKGGYSDKPLVRDASLERL